MVCKSVPPNPPNQNHKTHRSGHCAASCPSVPAHAVQGLALAGLGQNLAVCPTPWHCRQKSVLSRRKYLESLRPLADPRRSPRSEGSRKTCVLDGGVCR